MNTEQPLGPKRQLVTTEHLRAELTELELRIVDRIGVLETKLDSKIDGLNGRLWFAFSILAALIVGFGIFGWFPPGGDVEGSSPGR